MELGIAYYYLKTNVKKREIRAGAQIETIMVPEEDYEFDKIVANARSIAGDSEEVTIKLVEEAILRHFIQSSCAQKKQKRAVVVPASTFSPPFIPKRRRSSVTVLDHKPKTKPFEIGKRKFQLLEDRPSSSSSSSSSAKKKPATVKVKRQLASNIPPPDMPMEVKNRIESLGGSDVKLVIQKALFKTDVSRHHDRLTIPVKQVMTDFLKNDEKLALEKKDAVPVRVLEPYLGETIPLNLRRWQMNSPSYVFNGGWYHVVERTENNLIVGHIIQVWSFRVDGGLCFALLNLGQINVEEGLRTT